MVQLRNQKAKNCRYVTLFRKSNVPTLCYKMLIHPIYPNPILHLFRLIFLHCYRMLCNDYVKLFRVRPLYAINIKREVLPVSVGPIEPKNDSG